MRISIRSLFIGLVFSTLFLPLIAQEELKSWQHQGGGSQFPTGIGSADWYALHSPVKAKKIVVAVIDCGVDINHPDLKDNIWVNPREIPGNKKDDDGNGYVDDIYGWNFLGGPDGTSVVKEALEVTRLYGKERAKWENIDSTKLKGKEKKEYHEFLVKKEIVETKRKGSEEHIEQVKEMESIVMTALNAAKELLNGDTLDVARLEKSDKEEVQTAAKIIRNVEDQGVKVESIDWLIGIANDQFLEQTKADEDNINYSYNPDYNARKIIGDNYSDYTNRFYGNNKVNGEFKYHGTHVSGIIGAERNNGIGMDGIADDVAIMAVNVVPDGDERDKDVANAIRYAVDNGAEVINMSFGKGYSPEKKLVDDAVKYSAKHDVLLVLAAGNESANLDKTPNFPSDTYAKKPFLGSGTAKNLICVGALSPEGGEQSIAEFSDYGKKEVDVFAPGLYIYSTTPDSSYDFASGTSMASPVVTGVATMIRSRYPTLTAQQVKEVIMKSARKLPAQVLEPGTYDMVSPNVLSVSGGAIDMPAAMKLAATTKGKRKTSQIPAEYVRPAAKT